MKQVLLLYRFNPYHNRIIKKYDTTAEYIAAAGAYLSCEYPKNFAYRDGVTTTMRVKLDTVMETPDYLLILSDTTTPTIESRWYVMDADITSGTVCTMELRRDVMADYYNEVIDAPTFIEKATLGPSDPFVFNTENITVNKIKKGENLLQDTSKCAWVVGYLASNVAKKTIITQEAVEIIGSYADIAAMRSNFAVGNYVKVGSNNPVSEDTRIENYYVDFTVTRTNYLNNAFANPYAFIVYKLDTAGALLYSNQSNYKTLAALSAGEGISYAPFKTELDGLWSSVTTGRIYNDLYAVKDNLFNGIASYFSLTEQPEVIADYVGKNIKIGNKYYKLNLALGSIHDPTNNFATNANYDAVNAIRSMDCWNQGIDAVAATEKTLTIGAEYRDVYLEAVEITDAQVKFEIDPDKSRMCAKLPYRMFCIPYSKTGAISVKYGDPLNPDDTFTMASDLALTIAKAISTEYSSSNTLYDIQLLPYCPAQEIIQGDHAIVVPNSSLKTTLVVDGNNDNIGIIYWCANNTITFDITHSITINEVKLESITDQYRLSSPNWNGQFEFNAAKNGGVTKFNIDITYKPHTPYIHINPDFGRLYGEDFDDARGLICAGDFSLPQTSDAWNAYEIQNKNYQNQFQRDIQSLELTQSIQMKQQTFAALTGIASGAVSGAATGMMMGGLGGAVAGGVIGAGLSGAGAAMDIKYQKQLNEEAIDYRQDQFGFQLENIKALPQNLTNVGGLTANNKLFPVLEYYSCTEEEKAAIRSKLYYNGMTVDRIGTIGEFLQNTESYIKGKLIRITIDEDNHFIEAIANELDRGVFIK